MRDIIPPGTVIGPLTREMADATGLGAIPVIAPATHDTASAVAAVPASGSDWAYISSGTWSLMGVEIPQPLISDRALGYNFTNEGGVNGTIRFLKNIMGLWPVQRLRADFGGGMDYAAIANSAAAAPSFKNLIDVDDKRFMNPESMSREFADYFEQTGQKTPDSQGGFFRCAFESLALQYSVVMDELRETAGAKIERLHVIGGGSKNALLCQMAADATGIPVTAGPTEATCAGNILMQARAMGEVSSLAESREIVAKSFSLEEYEPRTSAGWEEARERYRTLKGRNK
jgi:rhamnulokinase